MSEKHSTRAARQPGELSEWAAFKARVPFLLRKAPENEEDEEERAELNQSEDAETAENAAGGP